MSLNLLVYEPPLPGLPFLAVAIETEASAEVLYAEAHPSLAAAEAAILSLAERMKSDTAWAGELLPSQGRQP